MKEFVRHPRTYCYLTLLISFFLPWVSLAGAISFSGPQIPKLAEVSDPTQKPTSERCIDCLGRGRQLFGRGMCMTCDGTGIISRNEERVSSVNCFYLAYIIPLLSLIQILLGLAGKRESNVGLVILGFLPWALLVLAILTFGGKVFDWLGIGAYLTLLAATVILVSPLIMRSLYTEAMKQVQSPEQIQRERRFKTPEG